MSQVRVAMVTDRIGVVESYSIPVISASAKEAGHEVILIEYEKDPKKAVKKLKDFKPDVLAYSVMSPDAAKFLEINSHLKEESGAYSIFGGVHPTFFQEYINKDGVDAICVGEGDMAIRDFLNNFGSDKMLDTTNMHFKLDDGSIKKNGITRLIDDLDTLPPPDKALMYEESYGLKNMPIRGFFASRGCPYKCTYCFNHAFNEMYKGKGDIVRTKSVPYMIKEIQTTIARYPSKFLKFHDDVFGIKREWLEEFAEVYPKEVGLPYVALVRPNMVDEEYAKTLKKSGAHAVCIAIESGNADIRNKVMLRSMKDEQIYETFDILRKHGIKSYCLNMLGLPGESEETFKETVRINQDCKVDYADASIFQPYPGVGLTKYARDNGYLDEENENWGGQYSETVLNFPQKLKDRLHSYQVVFPLLVEFPWLERHIELIEKIYKKSLGKKFLGLVYRFTYGWMLHRRIYPAPVPFKLLAWTGYKILTSAHRN
ncbi:MAG: B12-binding domain-containing radical SAM protein [Rhodospirillales bacterium]|nr:B12-binding domain-containing radical SAM protein [Rhodospirillales bacterium]